MKLALEDNDMPKMKALIEESHVLFQAQKIGQRFVNSILCLILK